MINSNYYILLGIPAFIGFNAGNGTNAFEYKPYSQTTYVRDLPGTGGANGFPGRHIFRIDEKIIPGVCIRDLSKFFKTIVLTHIPVICFLKLVECRFTSL